MASEAIGRWFESSREHFGYSSRVERWVVAPQIGVQFSVVKLYSLKLPCGASCRGFESRQPPQFLPD